MLSLITPMMLVDILTVSKTGGFIIPGLTASMDMDGIASLMNFMEIPHKL